MALRHRATPIFQNSVYASTSSLAIRGPKKKKGQAKSEAPESSDIVNIFKDRPDAVIHATDKYPPWLMNMLEESYTPDDVMMQIYRGERIPTGAEQWSLMKSFRRTYLNDQNSYLRHDWHYESEDDVGEDLGMEDEQEMEQAQAAAAAAAGEGGESKEEKKEEKKVEGGDKK